MRYLAAFLFTIVAVSAVHAETYEWVDSAGVTHFTDDPDRVPAKYRSRVKARESVKSDETSSAPAQQAVPVPAKPAVPAQQEVYGGHDEAWWRSEFSNVRNELKSLQDGLPEKRDRLTNIHRSRVIYQKPSDREAYNKLNQEIKGDEARVKELQDKLVALDRQATTAGVPMEWRQ